MSQLSLFDSPKPAPERRPVNLESIRKHVHAKLKLVRRAEIMPWGAADADYWERFFPQLAGLLPAEEAAPLVAEFKAELERLKGRR